MLLAPIQNNTFYWTPLNIVSHSAMATQHNYINMFPIFLLLTVFDCCFFSFDQLLELKWTQLSNHQILKILLFKIQFRKRLISCFFIVLFSQRNKYLMKLFRWSQTWSLIYFSNQIYPVWRRWKRLQIDYYTLSRIGNNTPTHTERSTNILRLSIHTQTCIHCIKGTVNKKKETKFSFWKYSIVFWTKYIYQLQKSSKRFTYLFHSTFRHKYSWSMNTFRSPKYELIIRNSLSK